MWLTCLRALRIPVAGAAAMLLVAPPAAADERGYLLVLHGRWASQSDQQLLSEARKVCNATRGGTNSADAILIVQKDLKMGVPEASQVVAAAVAQLGC
jgi:hypothetical protein